MPSRSKICAEACGCPASRGDFGFSEAEASTGIEFSSTYRRQNIVELLLLTHLKDYGLILKMYTATFPPYQTLDPHPLRRNQ